MEVVEKMKKATKRLLAAFLALAMVFTLLAVPATSMKDVSAATSKTVYINPYSDRVVSYKPDRVTQVAGVISIMGCTKASQIKKLKCSNKERYEGIGKRRIYSCRLWKEGR